jgi:hypothetical protein
MSELKRLTDKEFEIEDENGLHTITAFVPNLVPTPFVKSLKEIWVKVGEL